MKIALCLSGQPRYIRECFPSIEEKLLNKYDVDVYAHLWWDKSLIGQKFKFHAADVYEENMAEVFCTYYSAWIQAVEFQKSPDIKLEFLDFSCGEQADQIGENKELWTKEVALKQWFMWYSMSKCHRMIQDKEYDCFIRARTDLIFTKDLELEKYLDGKLYLDDFENKQQLCDWFGLSSKKQSLSGLTCAKTYNDYGPVITSTSILKRSLNEKSQWLQWSIAPFGVNIFRGYKSPKHMSTYSSDKPEDFPYWMQK